MRVAGHRPFSLASTRPASAFVVCDVPSCGAVATATRVIMIMTMMVMMIARVRVPAAVHPEQVVGVSLALAQGALHSGHKKEPLQMRRRLPLLRHVE